MVDHPYEDEEAGYLADGTRRYRQVADDVTSRMGEEDDEEIGTQGFAAAIAGYVGLRARERGLKPASTAPAGPDEFEWFDDYVRSSYDAGYEFARDALRADGRTPSGGRMAQNSYHQRGLSKIHNRQRQKWTQLADDVTDEIQSALSSRVESGASLQQARAQALDRIAKTGVDRAKRIATYEPAWAFTKGTVEEYRAAGVSNVEIDLSWETAGDARVCEVCLSRAGTYSVTEVDSMLESENFPAHPYCRCLIVPS